MSLAGLIDEESIMIRIQMDQILASMGPERVFRDQMQIERRTDEAVQAVANNGWKNPTYYRSA